MATGLLGGVLPYIYSRADALKRTLGDVVSNPMASTEQAVNYANDRARYLNQLNAQVSSQGLKGLMSPQGQELARLYTEAYNPVGMTAKSVSPKIGINVNQGGSSFADKIISGEKKFETRESDSLRAYVGKRVGIIRTGEGKAKAIGDVTLGEPIVVSSPEEFAKLRDLHLVPEGSKFDIKQGGVKYLYPIENPVPYGVEKDVAKYGIVSRKILGEPDTLEKALYPQQAALPTGATGLPSPQSLTMPSVPTVEQMQKYGRTETVPLSKAVSFQSARDWEKFNAGKYNGDLVAGYGDKPLALRLETGEYVIYDGNHRTDLALQKGLTELPMNVIDVKSYDPTHAGRRPVPPSMSDDELLNSLLGNEVKAPQQVPQEISPTFTDPFGNTIGSSIR